MPTNRTSLLLLLLASLPGCGEDAQDQAASAGPADRAVPTAGDPDPAERPAERVDTIRIEGTAEPIRVTLFETPGEFPLPFSAYVPEDMAAESDRAEDGASARFAAEFGGERNPDAFVHLFVFPEGTPESEALAVVRAYEASRGIPVSAGLELLPPQDAAIGMPWAERGYTFRYEDAAGEWYSGTIGLGEHAGRLFHIVNHYPAEYGDGFVPRARLILETWRWADGARLMEGAVAADAVDPS